MTEQKPEQPFANSTEAYIAIHNALSHGVECLLDDCEYDEAIKLAEKMRDIEGHTDV